MRAPIDERKPLPLDRHVLSKLADVARVPETERDFFNHCVRDLVDMVLNAQHRYEIWKASDLRASPKRIARAARDLSEAIEEASPGARELIRLSIPAPRTKTLDDYRAMAKQLSEAAELAYSRGRPTNPHRDIFRPLFIEQLKSDASRADGKLTLNQRTERGTLMVALDLLSPYLPKEFSDELSYSTVRRIIRRGGQKSRKTDKTPEN
jgi:histone H3/H4